MTQQTGTPPQEGGSDETGPTVSDTLGNLTKGLGARVDDTVDILAPTWVGRAVVFLSELGSSFLQVWVRVYMPALVALIAAVLFMGFGQLHEVYVELALDAISLTDGTTGPGAWNEHLTRGILGTVMIWLSGFSLWYFARRSLGDGPEGRAMTRAAKDSFARRSGERRDGPAAQDPRNPAAPATGETAADRLRNWLITWLPRVIGLLPAAGIFYGTVITMAKETMVQVRDGVSPPLAHLAEIGALGGIAALASGVVLSLVLIQLDRHRAENWILLLLRSLLPMLAGLAVLFALFWSVDLWGLDSPGRMLNDAVSGLAPGTQPSSSGLDILAEQLRFIGLGAVLVMLAAQLAALAVSVSLGRRLTDDVRGRGWIRRWLWPALLIGAFAALGIVALLGHKDLGAWLATTYDEAEISGPIMQTVVFGLLGAGICAIALVLMRRHDYVGGDSDRGHKAWRPEVYGASLRTGGFLCAAVFVALALYFAGDELFGLPTAVEPAYLGPIGVIGLFLAVASGIFALVSSLGRRYSMPATGLFLGLPLVLAAFSLNEHHYIPLVELDTRGQEETSRPMGFARAEAATPAPAERGGATTRLAHTLEQRVAALDTVAAGHRLWREEHRGEACERTVIVATQGGGHYAAYHAAIFLAQMQDRAKAIGDETGTPLDFASCVFAVSGISGGSVGAGVFAAALQRMADCRGEGCPASHVEAVREVLEADLLSPIGARLLFSDVLGDVFASSRLDRSRALANAVTARAGGGDTLFSRQLFETWPVVYDSRPSTAAAPARDHVVPAMFLNTVDVSTGQRLVLTPFREIEPGRRPPTYAQVWEGCAGPVAVPEQTGAARREGTAATDPVAEETEAETRPDRQWHRLLGHAVTDQAPFGTAGAPTLATAMFMSARFPVVTPPARIDLGHPDCPAPHVIDGGAYDNSGVETARDIIEAIRADELEASQEKDERSEEEDEEKEDEEKEEEKAAEETKFALVLVGFEAGDGYDALEDGRLPVDELLAPPFALNNARSVRTLRTQELAAEHFLQTSETYAFCLASRTRDRQKGRSRSEDAPLNRACDLRRISPVAVLRNRLDAPRRRAYKLSWLMSRRSFCRIREITGVLRDEGSRVDCTGLSGQQKTAAERRTLDCNEGDVDWLLSFAGAGISPPDAAPCARNPSAPGPG